MGIVNVTPDSFSDGGRFFDPDRAVAHGLQLVKAGAHILDIGGESTRPGAAPVSPAEEMARVVPVIEALKVELKGSETLLSIDTRHSATMAASLTSGVDLVNDISGLTHDPQSPYVVREANVPVCLMHMQGSPMDMQEKPLYNNVVEDVYCYLEQLIHKYETFGINKNQMIVDPGIGFGKTLGHNLDLLQNIRHFHGLDCPILVGASRKSFIGKLMEKPENGPFVDKCSPAARVPGSLATALHCVDNSVHILRVHDVAETKQALTVWEALKGR